MTSRLTKHLFLAAVAALSLFATAVPACACSHHGRPAEVKTETSSCHSHSAPPARSNVCQTGDCLCVPQSQPAVDKTSQFKLTKHETVAEIPAAMIDGFVAKPLLNRTAVIPCEILFHSTDPPGSLRSRAPPRL